MLSLTVDAGSDWADCLAFLVRSDIIIVTESMRFSESVSLCSGCEEEVEEKHIGLLLAVLCFISLICVSLKMGLSLDIIIDESLLYLFFQV